MGDKRVESLQLEIGREPCLVKGESCGHSCLGEYFKSFSTPDDVFIR